MKDEQNCIEVWEIMKRSFAEKLNWGRTIMNESWTESKLNDSEWELNWIEVERMILNESWSE
jgi:hypothetical protein